MTDNEKAELLAAAIGGKNAADFARLVMRQANGSLRQVRQHLGDYTKTRAGKRLACVMEVADRYAAERPVSVSAIITSPGEVYRIMEPVCGAADQESMYVLYLNTQHALIAHEEITRGTLNASLVHSREVFRGAIRRAACSIILCHNHPSGDPTPSADDRKITSQMYAAGKLLDIPLHDHVIIGRGRYASFAESGLLG